MPSNDSAWAQNEPKYAVEVETLVDESSSSSSEFSPLLAPPVLVGEYPPILAAPRTWRAFLRDQAHLAHTQLLETAHRAKESADDAMRYINDRYTSDQKHFLALLLAIVIGLYVTSLVFIYNPPPILNPPNGGTPPPDTEPPAPPTDPSPPPPVLEPAPLCASKDCVVASARILVALDESVDPCDDFYRFSCGNWIKSHPIPSTSSKETTMTTMNGNNNAVLKSLLTQNTPPSPNDPTSLQTFLKMQTLYTSCLSPTQQTSSPTHQLAAFLNQKLVPQLPTIINTFPSGAPKLRSTNLVQLVSAAQEMGLSTLFTIGVQPSPVDPSHKIVSLLPWETATLGLGDRKMYANATVLSLYERTIADALKIVMGGNREWDKVAKDVVWFEKEVARIMPSAQELFANDSVTVSLAQLQTAAPFISWTDYLRLTLASSTFAPQKTLSVPSLLYFSDLSNLILSLRNTDAIDGYFLWMGVWKWGAKYGGPDVREAVGTLEAVLTGAKKSGNVVGVDDGIGEEACLEGVTEAMGDAVARWFVEEAFHDETGKEADAMMQAIRNSFHLALPKYKWMDKQTNSEAQKKLGIATAVLATSGYDPSILNPESLAYRYLPIEPKPDTFMTNVLEAKVASFKYKLGRVDEKVDRREAEYPVTAVNAYYDPGSNSIMMNAGILQPPCFSHTQPSYLNYGACGSVMGHELTHGFDNSGRQYDAQGKLRDWWTPATRDAFDERTQCFVDQYSNFTVPGGVGGEEEWKVDGRLTLGENVADNGGLLRALEAWRWDRAAVGGGARNAGLPGLQGYSEEQLFFVSFAQL
ncbi:hypothetical protein HDU98_010975, partial [Podochytrium sp. JEL0797]